MKRFKNILCVVQPDAASKTAIERAVSLAENNQATLTVVDVIEPVTAGIGMEDDDALLSEIEAALISDQEHQLNLLLEPYLERIDIDMKILKGDLFLAVIREVLIAERDLVIKAATTPDWLDHVFGSEDMHLLRKCPCPVWMIKPGKSRPYRKIMAAVDVSDQYPAEEQANRHALNMQILQMAGSLALSEFSELHVVHTWQAVGESAMRGSLMNTSKEKVDAYVDRVRKEHETRLKDLLREADESMGKDAMAYINADTHLIKGRARKEIPQLARNMEVDLVVMGTVARTGIPGFFMGNTAETILSQIDCSVLAVKPPGFKSPVELEE